MSSEVVAIPMESAQSDRQAANLTGVPETMLWTLHNRACEARRQDGILIDPTAVRIYDSLLYDYERSFGPADASHAIRSVIFDREVASFLHRHPDGTVVNLAEGLETQRFRVPHGEALWISVDLPEGIAIRERFIAPDDRHIHLGMSALDRGWFDAVPADKPVYITAQGLLMYFQPEEVEALVRDMAAAFPGGSFAFDYIPRWLARKTLRGWHRTPHYRTPPMPWGINRDEVMPTLAAWCGAGADLKDLPWHFPRGALRWFAPLCLALPPVARHCPGSLPVRFPDA